MENMSAHGVNVMKTYENSAGSVNGRNIWTSTIDLTNVLRMVVRNYPASPTAEVFFGMNVRSTASTE